MSSGRFGFVENSFVNRIGDSIVDEFGEDESVCDTKGRERERKRVERERERVSERSGRS